MPIKDISDLTKFAGSESGTGVNWLKDAIGLVKELNSLAQLWAKNRDVMSGANQANPDAQLNIGTKAKPVSPNPGLLILLSILDNEVKSGRGDAPITANKIMDIVKQLR